MPLSERNPKMNALLMCDRVIHDADTEQVSLIGLRESFTLSAFPAVIPPVSVYAQMTDALGEYVFKLELVRRDDISSLLEIELAPVTVEDPMTYIEAVFRLEDLTLEWPGYYDARLFVNGTKFLDGTAFLAEEAPRRSTKGVGRPLPVPKPATPIRPEDKKT